MTDTISPSTNGKASGISRRRIKPKPAKPEFVQLSMSVLEDPKLTDRELRVLLAVMSAAWVDKKTGERHPCTLSMEHIAERAGGKSQRQTREILGELVERGTLKGTWHGGLPTEYRIEDPGGFPSEGRGKSSAPPRGKSSAEVEELQVEEGSSTPLTPAGRGSQNQKPGGTKVSSRAEGTNPRRIANDWDDALAEDDRRKHAAHRAWTEATDPDPPPDGQDERWGQGEEWEAWRKRQVQDDAGAYHRHHAYRWVRIALRGIQNGKSPEEVDAKLRRIRQGPFGGDDWQWIGRTLQAYSDGTLPERAREFIDNPPKFVWSTPSGRLPG
jgi:hypothetical protein